MRKLLILACFALSFAVSSQLFATICSTPPLGQINGTFTTCGVTSNPPTGCTGGNWCLNINCNYWYTLTCNSTAGGCPACLSNCNGSGSIGKSQPGLTVVVQFETAARVDFGSDASKSPTISSTVQM